MGLMRSWARFTSPHRATKRRREHFNRAVALLAFFPIQSRHRRIQAALGTDPTCAIAYWGIALSDWGNPFAPGIIDMRLLQLGRESAERGEMRGQRRSVNAPISRRSASCTATLKISRSMRACSPIAMPWGRWRQNIRKTAKRRSSTHWRLPSQRIPATRPTQTRLKAGAILEKLFEEEPTHPGLAHYIIHAYDVPALAGRGAGRGTTLCGNCARCASRAAHAIAYFTRLGYWQESIDSNVAAAAAARRQDQTAEELHASDYETYAYLQTGQDEAAARIVRSLPEMASRFDPKALLIGAGPPVGWIFRARGNPCAICVGAAGLAAGGEACTQSETPFPYADAITWFARGLGAARLGTRCGGHRSMRQH